MKVPRFVGVMATASISAGWLAIGLPAGAADAGPTTTTVPAATPSATTSPITLPPTTTTTVSPAQLLASAIAAASGQRALDWRQTVSEGRDSYTQVTHAGRLDGTSSVTVRVGTSTLKLNWDLIGKTVYFNGNSGALTDALGFTTAAAKKEAGKWISVTASAGAVFQDLSSYLTVSSATTILDLVGQMTFLPATTVRGETVLGIQGIRLSEEEKVTETIYVKATGTPLPVELSQTGQGSTGYTYFGPWGQPPAAKAPASALKLSKAWLASS